MYQEEKEKLLEEISKLNSTLTLRDEEVEKLKSEGDWGYILKLETQLEEKEAIIKNLQDEKDNFAISFVCWLKGEEGQMYEATGMSAYALLEKYKDRPFISTNINHQ
jgi:hypothetical protein